MTSYEPRVVLPPGAVAPDNYNPTQGRIPSPDFVVSRSKDGSALSVYGDSSWDVTPYDPDGNTRRINFTTWYEGKQTTLRKGISEEMRWVMHLLRYMRPGDPLSNGGLLRYLQALRFLARACEVRSISLENMLSSPALLVETIEGNSQYAAVIGSLLRLLNSLGSDVVGYHVTGNTTRDRLSFLHKQYKKDLQQHSPIPTRIYSLIILALTDNLNDFERAIDRLLAIYSLVTSDPVIGRSLSRQTVIKRGMKERCEVSSGMKATFADLLDKFELRSFFANRGYAESVDGLSTAISEAQITASFQIQTFSGMRRDEVRSLPFQCIETVKRNGKHHHIIDGRTTKLSNGLVKRARWVTSESGRQAVLLSQKIAQTIYRCRGATNRQLSADNNSFWLFVAPLCARDDQSGEGLNLTHTTLHLKKYPGLRARFEPVIEERDLLELESIDPHRAWRSEAKFQVGQRWCLQSHQLRRSLALYAQRSGLVTLPTLKRQLQHITHEMTLYYARGSAFAKNFIGDEKEHFGVEWQETQPISQYLSYVANFLLSDDIHFGAHVNWVDHHLKDSDGTLLLNREETLKRFKAGQLAYKETILGGCVKIGECDTNPLDHLEVNCLANHCKNMVGRLDKLNRVIAVQMHRVKRLEAMDPMSSEFRNEKSDLELFIATRESVTKRLTLVSEAT